MDRMKCVFAVTSRSHWHSARPNRIGQASDQLILVIGAISTL